MIFQHFGVFLPHTSIIMPTRKKAQFFLQRMRLFQCPRFKPFSAHFVGFNCIKMRFYIFIYINELPILADIYKVDQIALFSSMIPYNKLHIIIIKSSFYYPLEYSPQVWFSYQLKGIIKPIYKSLLFIKIRDIIQYGF